MMCLSASLPASRPALASMVCVLWLAGCAGTSGMFNAEVAPPPFRDQRMSMLNASDAVVIGRSTQAEVVAALGPATVVRFDSGYEVWAYRGKTSKAAAPGEEFVILFAPSGIVKKTRIRPAPEKPAN